MSKIVIRRGKLKGDLAALEGSRISLLDLETGWIFMGRVRIKAVRCGKKNCTRCPHKSYAYAQFRTGKKVTEKYLGVVN